MNKSIRILQKKYNLTLYPFILKGVAGVPSLNQKDGLHPNRKGHQVIANHLWIYLKPLLHSQLTK